MQDENLLNHLLEMKAPITCEVGHTKIDIAELLQLGQGSIVELNTIVGEELRVYYSGKLIAKGECVVVNEHFGVRITEIISKDKRINHLEKNAKKT